MTDPQQPLDPEPPEADAAEAWFDETWTKVHPLSPLVRGWLTVVAIPVAVFGYNWQMWADLWNSFRSGELAENLERNPVPYLIGGGAFLALAVLIFVGFTLSWWFTRYKITDEHVMVKSGILFRQHRQARIDRVQAVDLRQPLPARITGLAELKFEVAEGDGTAATLAFLKRSEAEQLRADIMDRASGRSSGQAADQQTQHAPGEEPQHVPGEPHHVPQPPAPSVPEADRTDPHRLPAQPQPERTILQVPIGRLIGSVLVGVGTIILVAIGLILLLITGGIAVAFAIFTDDSLSEALSEIDLPLFIPLLLGAAATYYSQFSSGFRFTATMTEAGLRLKYGLLETTTQTVPPGRVQAIQIQQPYLWRAFGWYKVVVTVAGYGITDRTTLMPVGTVDDAMRMTAEMFPDLQVDHPEELFLEGVSGTGTAGGFTEVPARAKIFDPLVRTRRGSYATPSALMIRDGRLTRLLTMVPHERIQSAALSQGPLARAKRIATLDIHIPAGPITARIKNQDVEQIRELFQAEAGYAAVARRLAERNQWMQPEELHEFEKMVQTAPEAEQSR
ncbi:PH domain-containing protein [Nesterenkonia sp.]|uniref:PH domain-containing protein n=1 Tax=Nesterenkonia sp. TaxID=704201 RepID=UPI00261DF6F3|nr:PH domain-containing protein [Nesterenkonia sp.]